MEILQFCLLAWDVVWRGRTPFLAVKSNRFGKPWEIELDYSYDEVKDIRKRTVNGPSRKIFRSYLPELLKERLLTRILTRDRRSKYYAITPLGIIHLIKSEMFFDGLKYPHPERNYVLLILQTFAQQNVKPYHSIIFENEKFIKSDFELLDDIGKSNLISLREAITHVFTNVDIEQHNVNTKYESNSMEYFITNGYPATNRIRLANFDLEDKDFITITELDQIYSHIEGGLSNVEGNKILKLDYEQFHHYLANLMICSLVYDSAMLHYDLDRLMNMKKARKKKLQLKLTDDEFKEQLKTSPEYFLKIILLFSKHIFRLTQNQQELITNFSKNLNEIEFMKTRST